MLSLYGLNGPENIDIPLAYNVKGIVSGACALENYSLLLCLFSNSQFSDWIFSRIYSPIDRGATDLLQVLDFTSLLQVVIKLRSKSKKIRLVAT